MEPVTMYPPVETMITALWAKRFWTRRGTGADVNLHVRVSGSPNERLALLFRDWMCAHPACGHRVLGDQAIPRRGDTRP